MPKRIQRDRPEAPADTAADDLPSPRPIESTADVELAEVDQQLPQGAKGTLWKFTEGGDRAFCESLQAADLSLDRLRTRWGPGRFVIFWRKPDEKRPGRSLTAGTTRFELTPDQAATPSPAAAPAAGAIGLGAGTEYVKAMLEGQQLLHAMQVAVLKNLTEPRQGSELMEKILLALITRDAKPAPGMDLNAVITLADRLANRTNPTSAMKDALGLLEQARELAGEGGGEQAPAWIQLAAKALDTIGRAVSRSPDQPAGAEEPPAAIPETTTAPPPNPEVSPLPPTAHAVFHFLAPHIPALLRHAIADHDPATYAGVIFDQLQPEYFTEVRDYISRPDFLDLLEASFPQLRGPIVEGSDPPQPVREWFRELRDDLVNRIQEDQAPPEIH